MMEERILICACHSLEHMVMFWHDKEDGLVYVEVHLYTHEGFFKRLWRGLRFAFGYRCRYGEWDSVLLDEKSVITLREFLNSITPILKPE